VGWGDPVSGKESAGSPSYLGRSPRYQLGADPSGWICRVHIPCWIWMSRPSDHENNKEANKISTCIFEAPFIPRTFLRKKLH
jgi:hypothetical protein